VTVQGSSGQVPMPKEPRQPGEVERTINRIQAQKDRLISLVAKADRIANDLLGAVPPGELNPVAPLLAEDYSSGGLMGALVKVLDEQDVVLHQLDEIIERMEKIA